MRITLHADPLASEGCGDPADRSRASERIQDGSALLAAFEHRPDHGLRDRVPNTVRVGARQRQLTGRQAESALRAVGMTLNRNSLPFDANGPWYTSGLRLGTPALTTLGMGTDEVDEIADVAVEVLRATAPVSVNGKASQAKYETEAKVVQEARARITALCDKFPVYPEIDLSIVEG